MSIGQNRCAHTSYIVTILDVPRLTYDSLVLRLTFRHSSFSWSTARMTVVNQGGERRSFEDAADERQPLLGENLDAYGKVPQEDRAIAIYAASQSISTRTLGDDPPHKPWGPLMVLLALTVRAFNWIVLLFCSLTVFAQQAVQPLCFELIFPFVSTSTSATLASSCSSLSCRPDGARKSHHGRPRESWILHRYSGVSLSSYWYNRRLALFLDIGSHWYDFSFLTHCHLCNLDSYRSQTCYFDWNFGNGHLNRTFWYC